MTSKAQRDARNKARRDKRAAAQIVRIGRIEADGARLIAALGVEPGFSERPQAITASTKTTTATGSTSPLHVDLPPKPSETDRAQTVNRMRAYALNLRERAHQAEEMAAAIEAS